MIRVMIVEDDPMVARINAEYVRRVEGFTVCAEAPSGRDALDVLGAGTKVDLIILDVYMPRMNGVEFLEALRRDYASIDVIFVTAAKERQIIRRGLELGAIDYLIKPFSFERIRTALARYRLRHKMLTETETMSQAELDRFLGAAPPEAAGLPKGISGMTLERVRDAAAAYGESELDLREMHNRLNLSLVTLRLYLDYMVEQGVLVKETRYGAVGRPTFVYKKRRGEK